MLKCELHVHLDTLERCAGILVWVRALVLIPRTSVCASLWNDTRIDLFDQSCALRLGCGFSFVASFAVLLFEPHTTMPPTHYATAVAIRLRSEWIAI